VSKRDDAEHDLMEQVGPILTSLTGSRCISVEAMSNPVTNDLDIDAGIDFYLKFERAPLFTFASRIQWRHYNGHHAPWSNRAAPMTYTIRCLSGRGESWVELEKKRAALTTGGLYPRWTLQAYLERPGGPVENMGWCLTEDLYAHLDLYAQANVEPPKRINPQDNSEFIYVDWRWVPGYRWFRSSDNPALASPRLFK